MTAHSKAECCTVTKIYSFVLNLSNGEIRGIKTP